MKKEFAYSVILHGLIITAMIFGPSLTITGKEDLGEVISVQVFSSSEVYSPTPEETIEPIIPSAIEESIPDIPISDPITVDEEIPIEIEPLPEDPKPDPTPEPAVEEAVVETPKPRVERKPQPTGPQEIHTPSTGRGATFAGATVDNASFIYTYWFDQAFNKILRNWKPHVLSDGAILCVVYFQVIKSGKVIDVKIIESSGIDSYDESCRLAIERSAPFPPLPRRFHDEVIGITIPIQFVPK